jgi:hypothetical protein
LREKSENGRTGEMHMGRNEGSKPASQGPGRPYTPTNPHMPPLQARWEGERGR